MCPVGVDQTGRLPQKWQILAPRLRQVHDLDFENLRGSGALVKSFFNDEKTWNVWYKLAKPVDSTLMPAFSPLSSKPIPNAAAKGSSIEGIPAELIFEILDVSTLAHSDIIAFGLASRKLWQYVRQHIADSNRSLTARWAGTEIACIGSYLRDLPPSFEKDDLAIMSVSQPDWNRIQPMPFRVNARHFNMAAMSRYTTTDENAHKSWASALSLHHERARIPESYWPQLIRDVSYDRMFPLGQGWALRNLDTNEYIRVVPGSQFQGLVDYPGAENLRLDDVLMIWICWTIKNCSAHYLLGEKVRGRWAGHRFDIVMFKTNFEDSINWQDVTEDAVKDAYEVYQIKYPAAHPSRHPTRISKLPQHPGAPSNYRMNRRFAHNLELLRWKTAGRLRTKQDFARVFT